MFLPGDRTELYQIRAVRRFLFAVVAGKGPIAGFQVSMIRTTRIIR